MTRALVVYESIFGDARKIAEAVADGLKSSHDVAVVAAVEAPPEVDVDLLVVGGPNHAFSMPRESTREGAIAQYGAVVADTTHGLHEWLGLAHAPRALNAAAFDIRMGGPTLLTAMDHAARTEEKLLRGLGATLAAPAEHFFVSDTKGPLLDGEADRARGLTVSDDGVTVVAKGEDLERFSNR